ncbi:tripartite motif-containing protein 3-like [Branchiostoma lanceolatum]|uniref:tripartite motif-containing protein 3-like n=1 Tax=Branchiostoma lanceolatum TaxID=7740 RepID=UPI0034536584
MAAVQAVPSSLGEQIREELTCSICLGPFTRPKVLPCQHTFCQDCLQKLTEGETTFFKCPVCRQWVRKPPKGVQDLPNNRLVSSLQTRIRRQATALKKKEESKDLCVLHLSEEIKLYCQQCDVPVCNECLDQKHSDHRTISLKKAVQERKTPVQALIDEGRNNLVTYCTFVKSLRDKEKTLKEQKQQTKDSIIAAYSQMMQKLADSRDHLLSEVEENDKENMEIIQKERDRVLLDVSELSAACDRADEEMDRGCVVFLHQETILTGVMAKHRGKAAPTPVQTQPAVFHPTDTPVPVVLLLGHVTVQSLANAQFPEAPASTNDVEEAMHVCDHQPQAVTFGGQGTRVGKFQFPAGITVSEEGEIFVADRWNKRIQVFTLQGTFVHQFPAAVPGGQAMEPNDVAIDGKGNLWVVGETEQAEFAVQYTKQGRAVMKVDLQKSGWVRGVAVDTRRNHVLVTQTTGDWDNPHGEVLVFRPDGTLVRTVGGKKKNPVASLVSRQQRMKHPWYITVDGEGNILVSDCGRHCIHVFNKDGQFLYKFGCEGSGEGQLQGPMGICTDRAGNIIVVNSGNGRVELFNKTGIFLKHITTDQWQPEAVAMTTKGQLLVTDLRTHAIHVI